MDVDAIQNGLAAAARNVTGLRAYATLPDSISPPTFATVEQDMDYQQTFGSAGGLTDTLFHPGVFVSRGDTPVGRSLLAGFVRPDGATSIRVALETDRTLGGACKTLIVERMRGSGRLYEIAGIFYLGAMFDVRVWA